MDINAVLDIKPLAPDEWCVLKGTRLRALQESPHAFASDYASEACWSDARWQQFLAAARWVVAVESGVVIGIAGLFDGGPLDGWHIESIWVEPTHRHLGVFRALLDTLVDGEHTKGARHLALWVLEHNHGALHAYRRLGFVPTGERQRLLGGRYELRLRLEITPPRAG